MMAIFDHKHKNTNLINYSATKRSFIYDTQEFSTWRTAVSLSIPRNAL